MSQFGRLLVATPLINDPNFERTVILVVAHEGVGAHGLVINRPTAIPATDIEPRWSDHMAAPAVLFDGGPVNRAYAFGFARGPDLSDHDGLALRPESLAGQRLVAGCVTLDLERPPDPETNGVTEVRLFAGSAGWSAGQLEDEMSDGAWWAVDATPDDVMTSDPSGLWTRVLRRQHGELAWFANHPDDPSIN